MQQFNESSNPCDDAWAAAACGRLPDTESSLPFGFPSQLAVDQGSAAGVGTNPVYTSATGEASHENGLVGPLLQAFEPGVTATALAGEDIDHAGSVTCESSREELGS